MYAIADRFVALLFGFGSIYLLLRLLSKEDFGEWALFVTVTALVEVARNGLIQNALIKYLASTETREHSRINTASLVLNLLLTALTIASLWILAPVLSHLWAAQQLSQLFRVYALTTLLLVPFSQSLFLQQANFNFKAIFWSNFVRQGIFFGYVLLCFALHRPISLLNLGICQIWGAAVGAVAAYWLAKNYWQISSHISWKWVNRLFQFGKYVLGTNLAAMIYKSVDKMMLGAILPTKAPVAAYDVAIRINNLNEVPTLSLAAMLFPESAKRAHQQGNDSVGQLYEQSVGIMLALVVPGVIAICLFPELIIRLTAGEKYLDTVNILRLTSLYTLFLPFAIQFGTAFDSMGKPQLNFAFVLIGTAVNAAINYFLIHAYGLEGAVYATLITFVLTFIGNQLLLRKYLNVRFSNIFWHTLDAYQMVIQKLKKNKVADRNDVVK